MAFALLDWGTFMVDREVVTIFAITPDRKFVMQRHKKEGAFLPPGGGKESGETHIEAGIRELEEEVGKEFADGLIIISANPINKSKPDGRTEVLPLPFEIAVHISKTGEKMVNYMYAAEAGNLKIANEENLEFSLFTLKEILKSDEIFPNVKLQAQKAYKIYSRWIFAKRFNTIRQKVSNSFLPSGICKLMRKIKGFGREARKFTKTV